ncbi:ReoY family proteolytic degradation factor [Salimicrobium sp. PL1-032A]|uniref:ReoY family proteolytic degradation factor n=1 Tax=Salimicrobium sp. PL1-032A TaxID=3095364 RepID=UPI003260AFE2
MTVSVSLTEKKRFLHWFLENQKLKKREGRWILNYLLCDDRALHHVTFTDHVEFCPRGLCLSCRGVEGLPLTFHKGKIRTADGDKAFHDIRMNPTAPLYLELDYAENHRCSNFALVKEDNLFLPNDYYVTAEEKGRTVQWMDLQLLRKQRDQLSKRIDEAMDVRDKQQFEELSARYVDIETQIRNHGKDS